MSLTVRIPSALRRHAGGAASVAVDEPGPTVATALDALFEIHPGLRDRLLTEQRNVRPHVALFVGPESIRHAGGLETPLADGEELTILPAVSGG